MKLQSEQKELIWGNGGKKFRKTKEQTPNEKNPKEMSTTQTSHIKSQIHGIKSEEHLINVEKKLRKIIRRFRWGLIEDLILATTQLKKI